MVALEEEFQTTIDEAAFARRAKSVADLERSSQQRRRRPTSAGRAGRLPALEPHAGQSRALRRVSLPTWILPLARVFAWIRVEGREHLDGLEGPVMFAANHQSHMDTPVILAALPAGGAYRVAVAMAKEFFKAHFFPERATAAQWFTNSLNYYLAALFFNAFPLPQREAGARQTLRYIGELLADGCSVLIFPEGRRTETGEINEFRPGIGMIGARLDVPVVPVRLEGVDRVLHRSSEASCTGGPPGSGATSGASVAAVRRIQVQGDAYQALARAGRSCRDDA